MPVALLGGFNNKVEWVDICFTFVVWFRVHVATFPGIQVDYCIEGNYGGGKLWQIAR